MIKARVTVTLKNGVLDPQGKAIEHALGGLGFSGVDSVRQGKVFDVEFLKPPTAPRPRPNSRPWAKSCSPTR
jgi:phosphoribosylformylglycinamidine synthase PurS subunit